MAPLTQTLSSDLSLPPNSYIYKIISPGARHDILTPAQVDRLAVISSDDSLRFLDPSTLKIIPDGIVKNANESITCLERVDDAESNIVATAGRDGFVRFWDKRSKGKALELNSPNKLISSLVCDASKNFIAAGIENPNDGPGESPVYIWDQRNPQTPQLNFVESHTDTVTSLQLHPSLPTLLLSSSTDGLINIFDISKPDEEDALYQVINHRSAVAHAGFMYPTTDIYALGTDETMSFYALQSQDENEEEPQPRVLGDVREGLGCEYLAKIHWVGDDAYVAAGKNSESSFDLIPLKRDVTGPPLQYEYDLEASIRLPDAHSAEVVRDAFTDIESHTTYTCGEDGHVRAWRFPSEDQAMQIDHEGESKGKEKKDRKEKRREKKEKRKGEAEGRYKPY